MLCLSFLPLSARASLPLHLLQKQGLTLSEALATRGRNILKKEWLPEAGAGPPQAVSDLSLEPCSQNWQELCFVCNPGEFPRRSTSPHT